MLLYIIVSLSFFQFIFQQITHKHITYDDDDLLNKFFHFQSALIIYTVKIRKNKYIYLIQKIKVKKKKSEKFKYFLFYCCYFISYILLLLLLN